MSAEDYCELCDLPKFQCIHGNPPPPPPPTVRKAPAARPVVRRAAASSRSSTTTAAPPRPVRHRWTPPDVFKPEIVAVLSAASGGELEQDEVFVELEVRMAERLTEADHEKTPEGELRWRYAARRARQALVAEGTMTKGRPGIWALG